MERRNKKRFEAFMLQKDKGYIPVYMFSEEDDDTILGLMLDISASGCRLLVSKSNEELPQKIRLKMLSSDRTVEEEIEIETNMQWCYNGYSIEHKAVGLKFLNEEAHEKEIERLVNRFIQHQEEEAFVRCELTPLR